MSKRRMLNQDYYKIDARSMIKVRPLNDNLGHSHKLVFTLPKKGK